MTYPDTPNGGSSRPVESFDDLAEGFGWSGRCAIVMLWARFDESGEHDRATGHLNRLTIGGVIANREAWRDFHDTWEKVLGNRYFHMTDFEARRGVWAITDQEHRSVLAQLLDPFDRHEVAVVSATVDAGPTQRRSFRRAYARAVHSLITGTLLKRDLIWNDEDIRLNFAWHEEFSANVIADIVRGLGGDVRRVNTVAAVRPETCRLMQVADLVAYEMVRTAQVRYPLARLNSSKAFFHLRA